MPQKRSHAESLNFREHASRHPIYRWPWAKAYGTQQNLSPPPTFTACYPPLYLGIDEQQIDLLAHHWRIYV